jgi:integrase
VKKEPGIEQRGSGTWRITVAAGRDPITGRYIRLRETVRGTKTEARRRRDELLVQVARGTAVQSTRETVAVFLERWIAHRQSVRKIRSKVAHTYRGYVRREIAPRIGAMQIAAVRPVHVQRVIDEALANGLSARSVVQVHRIMHAAFRQAVRWQAIAVNPSDGVTPPKVEQATLRVPGAADVARLIAAVGAEYRTPLALAAGTGLRRGEVLGLTWPAVDFDGRPRIRVSGTLQRADGSLVVLPPKTERSRRVVPLPASLAEALKRHRAKQNERRLIAGPAWGPGDFVFDRGNGQPLDPDTFSKAFRSAAQGIGLGGVRLHDLRHAFASMLVGTGTNARVVGDLLGHATVGFTLATYVHPDEDAAATAVAEAERLIATET